MKSYQPCYKKTSRKGYYHNLCARMGNFWSKEYARRPMDDKRPMHLVR